MRALFIEDKIWYILFQSQQDCLSLVNGANLDQALKHIVAILMCDEVRQSIVDLREH